MDDTTELVERSLAAYGHTHLSLDNIDKPTYLVELALANLRAEKSVSAFPARDGG